jgi:uncharacterized protein (TIGR02444 family)
MHEADAPSPDEPLWRFSLAFYALPGIAEALIALQDREGLDVNLMLFALWLGISGHRLDREELTAAERATCTIRSEIVEPLRTLRQRLKHHVDEDIQSLREGVKALELAGEKLMQTRLARLAERERPGIPQEGRLAAAHANLALYLGPERVQGGEAKVLLRSLAPSALVPADMGAAPPQLRRRARSGREEGRD